MHIPRSEGSHHDAPMLRPGFPMGNVARAHGSAANELAHALVQFDAALFRELTQKDVSKLLEIVARLSTPAAAAPNAKEIDPAKPVSGEHLNPGQAPVPAASLRLDVEPSADNVHAARFQAEARLAEVEAALGQPHSPHLADWDAPPAALLRVSQDMYAQGDYQNYLRSGEVAQALLDGLRAPVLLNQPEKRSGEEKERHSRRLVEHFRRPWIIALLMLLAAVVFYMLLR